MHWLNDAGRKTNTAVSSSCCNKWLQRCRENEWMNAHYLSLPLHSVEESQEHPHFCFVRQARLEIFCSLNSSVKKTIAIVVWRRNNAARLYAETTTTVFGNAQNKTPFDEVRKTGRRKRNFGRDELYWWGGIDWEAAEGGRLFVFWCFIQSSRASGIARRSFGIGMCKWFSYSKGKRRGIFYRRIKK